VCLLIYELFCCVVELTITIVLYATHGKSILNPLDWLIQLVVLWLAESVLLVFFLKP